MKAKLAEEGGIVLRTKVVGVTFEGRQANIRNLRFGWRLFWRAEPENPYDSKAILVFSDKEMTRQCGHLRKEVCSKIHQWVAEGRTVTMEVKKVTGGVDRQAYGLNIYVRASIG